MTNSRPEPYSEEVSWAPARLIPTTGIGGADEQERRATSALLAVMKGVPDFGRALLELLSTAAHRIPAGRIATFTEVQLKGPDGKVSIPDGAIVVARGKAHWRCLVEVKTGDNELRSEQVDRYLELARAHGFDAVLTITNRITSSPEEVPVEVDRRRTKRIGLFHLSWWQIITEAKIQHDHRGVSDPDQAWILSELIEYLTSPRSGAVGFEDMGDQWVTVREAARLGTLRVTDPGIRDVVLRWEQFVEYLSLRLSQDLGRDVRTIWPSSKDPKARRDHAVRTLAEAGRLVGAMRVPDTAAPVEFEANLRTRQLTVAAEVAAPREGRARTRVTWLLRQLADAPDDLRCEASFANTKATTSERLSEVRETPDRLLWPADPRREPKAFRLALTSDMGTKRGKGAGSFIAVAEGQTVKFYESVLQTLQPWRPSPPKLPPTATPVERGETAEDLGEPTVPPSPEVGSA